MAHPQQISVKEMVKNPIKEIPENFLIDQEPVIGDNQFPVVPTIDNQRLLNEETKLSELEKLRSTCKEWGIFLLVNHGLDSSLLEKLRLDVQEFFEFPLEEKLKFKIRDGEFEGYGQTLIHNSGDKRIDWADRFYMITNPVSRRKPHLLPAFPSPLRETLEAYISELQKLSTLLFTKIAEALKIDENEWVKIFEDGMQSVRMNYYPPCSEPDKVMGLTAHSDGSALTMLLQVNGVEGLQIKKDGVWMPVKFQPEALAVNVGDIVEVLSNGLYKSIEHRATVNSERERISLAVFFQPNLEAKVGPWPSLMDNQSPVFKTLTMEEYVNGFFSRKLKGKFLDNMRI